MRWMLLLLWGCELGEPEPVCTPAYDDCEGGFTCDVCTLDGQRTWQCSDGWRGKQLCGVEHHCFPSTVGPCGSCRDDCCRICVTGHTCGDSCVDSMGQCPPEVPDEGCACYDHEACGLPK